MPKDNESTMKFKADISQLKAAMQDAKRSISLANAEFKNATAGLGKWSTSITGVEAKIQQLSKTSESQRTVLANLEKQYDLVSKEMGEDSAEAQRLKVQIENQQAAIKKTDAQLDTYNGSLDELKAEQAAAQSPMGQLTSTIDQQEKAVDSLKKQYANAVLEFGKNSQEANRLGSELDSLSSDLAENKAKMADAERAADQLDKSIDDAGHSAENAAKGGFTVLKGTIANLAAAGVQKAMDFVSGLTSEALSSADALQKFEGTMGFAGFDASNIEKARESVKKYADDTVYDLDTVANTTAQLAANGVKDYTGLTQAAGNLNAVAGGNSDTFKSVAMMMTQTAGAGKLTTENWNQLADAIPGASGKLQEAMKNAGAYTGNFRDAMAKGEITADEFNAAIMELGNDPIAVEAATSVTTFEGAMGNLEATVVSGLMEIYDMIGSETITGFITSIADGISGIVPMIKEAVKWVTDNKGAILAVIAAIATALAGLFIAGGGFGIMTAAVTGWATAMKAAAMQSKLVTAAQWLLNAAMSANPIGLVVIAIMALIAAFAILWNTSEDFRNFWIGLWEKVKEVAGAAWESITGFFASAGESIQQAWAGVSQFFADLWKKIKQVFAPVADFFKTMFGNAWTMVQNIWTLATYFFDRWWAGIQAIFMPVIEFFSNIFNQAWQGIQSIWNNARGFFNSIWNNIKSVFNGVGSWFRGKFNDAWNKIKGVFSGVGNFFGGIWKTIRSKFSDIGTKVGQAIGGAFKTAVNAVLRTVENVLNAPIRAINGLIGTINKVPGINLSKLSTFNLPRMAFGGVLKRGQVGLLEGSGAEAVVPLEKNKKWIARVAQDMVEQLELDALKNSIQNNIPFGGSGSDAWSGASGARQQIVNFNQYNTSPKPLSRLDVYRDTKSILFSAKVGLANV